ncbi:MAG: hypothetical protein H6640_15360 [Caldilineaceae bacterium]|nr:hypothetical protein [Caldilineaceae bacterium]
MTKLESLGYKVGLAAWLIGNIWPIAFIGAALLIALLITLFRSLGIL